MLDKLMSTHRSLRRHTVHILCAYLFYSPRLAAMVFLVALLHPSGGPRSFFPAPLTSTNQVSNYGVPVNPRLEFTPGKTLTPRYHKIWPVLNRSSDLCKDNQTYSWAQKPIRAAWCKQTCHSAIWVFV